MAKSDAADKVDAIACAERCEAKAKECIDAFPSVCQQLTEAAGMLRSLHRALVQVECRHVLTFTVTKAMIDHGREQRAQGKYCMVCGDRLDKAQDEKPQESGEPA